MDPTWGQMFIDLIREVGFSGAIFTAFFFGSHYWIYTMYLGRLEDRQDEIDRLAQDNREYRERFLAITDDKFKYDITRKKVRRPKGDR